MTHALAFRIAASGVARSLGRALSRVALVAATAGGLAFAQVPHWPNERTSDVFGAGNAPVVVDVDADGRLDLVGLTTGTSTLTLLRGDGFGRFLVDPTFPSGIVANRCAAGDVDGDGDPDIVSHLVATALIQVSLNVNGSFLPPVPVLATTAANEIVARDVTGDGLADLLLYAFAQPIVLHRATGNAQFAGPTTLPSGPQTRGMFVDDVTQDGVADLVTFNADAQSPAVRVFRFDAAGTPTLVHEWVGSFGFTSGAAGDVTSDGIADILVAASGAPSSVHLALLRGTGAGTFAPTTFLNLGLSTPIASMKIRDVNSDGRSDLVVRGTSDVSAFLADGTGGLVTGGSSAILVDAFGFDVAEIDGRGGADLVTITSHNFWSGGAQSASGDDAGSFDAPTRVALAQFVHGGLGDANSDGEPDLLGATPNAAAFLRSNGLGSFTPVVVPIAGLGTASSIAVGDFDGDGIDDLVHANAVTGQCKTLLGTGAGGFTHTATLAAVLLGSIPVAPAVIEAVDLNADGALDLVAGFANFGLGVALNGGAGVFSNWTHVPGVASHVVVEDADGDGDLDVFTHGTTFGNVGWYRNDGLGAPVLAGFTVLGLENGGGQLLVEDISGDGRVDIAVLAARSSSSDLLVLRGSAPFTFDAPVKTVYPGLRAFRSHAVDVTADGAVDLVVAEHTGVRILERDGSGAFVATRSFGAPITSTKPGIEVFDADHDGAAELVFVENGAIVWRSGCGGKVGRHGYGCPGSGGHVPSLDLGGCPRTGSAIQLRVQRGLGASFALLVFGTNPAQTPIGGSGCSLLVQPLLPASVVLPLGGTGPGAGTFVASLPVPPGLSATSTTLQALIADPATPLGFSATQGSTIVVE